METIELTDGGILIYDETFLPAQLADRYFSELRHQIAWEQKPGIFGHMQPRLIASYGEPGIVYRYSGRDNVALPWTTTLLEIKEKIESVQGSFNYCLLNRYRHGQDSMGMHADNEPEMGDVIGSFVLGSDTHLSDQAQHHQEDNELRSWPRHAHHHGGHDAAILEARSTKNKKGRRRADQPHV